MAAENAVTVTTDRTRTLARLAVQLGANVAPGQDVFVLAFDVEQAPLAREIADAAYFAGARYVSVLYWDQHVKRSRLLHAPDESLEFVPDWWERHVAECLERRGAYIVVWGDPDPELLSDVDPDRAGSDHLPLTASLFALAGSGEVNWTFVPGPTRGMAERVLGTSEIEPLWDELAPILRLDEARPHRDAARARRVARRARIRRAAVPRARHRPARRAAPRGAMALRRLPDQLGPRDDREHADRGGVHDARLPARRRHGHGDATAAAPGRDGRGRIAAPLRGRPRRRG
jgi:hypothetical protein